MPQCSLCMCRYSPVQVTMESAGPHPIQPDRTTLSSSLSQVNIAQEEVGNACKDEAELETDIHSKGRIEQTGDGTDIVNLCCSKQHTYYADNRRNDSSPPNGKPATGIPIIDIVTSTAKDEVFQDHDDGPGTQPVRDE